MRQIDAEKREYVITLAEFLFKSNKKMSLHELASHLNRNGFTTDKGNKHCETRGRGTAKLLNMINIHYIPTINEHDKVKAYKEHCIAMSFVNGKGVLPWINKDEKVDDDEDDGKAE